MLGTAGVDVRWRNRVATGSESGCGSDITIRLTSGRLDPSEETGLHMAFALPHTKGGVGIRIRWDKIRAVSGAGVGSQSMLLAHVLVHEITHVLQGIGRHSREGVMQAFWNSNDFSQMARQPLPFTTEDVELIQLGWPRRMSACPAQPLPGARSRAPTAARNRSFPTP
jgi:hypothetical protein